MKNTRINIAYFRLFILKNSGEIFTTLLQLKLNSSVSKIETI